MIPFTISPKNHPYLGIVLKYVYGMEKDTFVKWREKKWQKDVNKIEKYLKAGENQTLTLHLQQS